MDAKEFDELLKKNNNLNNLLKEKVIGRLTHREQMYYTLSESIEKTKVQSKKQDPAGLTKLIRNIELNIKDIIVKCLAATNVPDLQIQIARLQQIEEVIMTSGLDDTSKNRLQIYVKNALRVIGTDVKKKNSFFQRIKDTADKNGLGLGSVVMGFTGGDPLAGFGVNFFSDTIRARQEQKKLNAQKRAKILNSDTKKFKMDIPPEPEQAQDATKEKKDPKPRPSGTGDGKLSQDILLVLEEIADHTELISKDVEGLLKLAYIDENRKAKKGLSDLEAEFESTLNRDKDDSKLKRETASGDVPKSLFRRILDSTLGKILPFAGFAATGLVSLAANPATWLAAGIVWTALDGIRGYFEAQEWGTTKLSGVVGAVLGGLDKGLSGSIKGAAKWGLAGAAIGSIVPGVGTLIGFLLGSAFGGIMGYLGGERIAKFVDSIGEMTMRFFEAFKKSIFAIMSKVLDAEPLKQLQRALGLLDTEAEDRAREEQLRKSRAEEARNRERRYRIGENSPNARERRLAKREEIDAKRRGLVPSKVFRDYDPNLVNTAVIDAGPDYYKNLYKPKYVKDPAQIQKERQAFAQLSVDEQKILAGGGILPKKEPQLERQSEIDMGANDSSDFGDKLVQGMLGVETGGLDNPWIRTKFQEKGQGPSSAWGPAQITRDLAKDGLNSGKFKGDPVLEAWVPKFIAQAQKFLDNSRGKEPYASDSRFGLGGEGELTSAADKKNYMRMAGILAKMKWDRLPNPTPRSFAEAWHGPGVTEKYVNRASKAITQNLKATPNQQNYGKTLDSSQRNLAAAEQQTKTSGAVIANSGNTNVMNVNQGSGGRGGQGVSQGRLSTSSGSSGAAQGLSSFSHLG